MSRDDFLKPVITLLQKRAAYICSNPHCRKTTLKAGDEPDDVVMTGIAAHICAASESGPRFDSNQTPEQRKAIDNGIYLCATCAIMIDKNKGVDFPAPLLRKWRQDHEEWVRSNFNRTADPQSNVSKLSAHFVVLEPLIKDYRFRAQCLFEREHRDTLEYQRMTNLYGPGEKITDEYPHKNALHYFFEAQEQLQTEISNLLKNIDLEDWPTIKNSCVLFIKACELRKGGDSALVFARAKNGADGSSSGEKWIEEYVKNSEGEPEFTDNVFQNAYISVWKQLAWQLNCVNGIESAVATLTEDR